MGRRNVTIRNANKIINDFLFSSGRINSPRWSLPPGWGNALHCLDTGQYLVIYMFIFVKQQVMSVRISDTNSSLATNGESKDSSGRVNQEEGKKLAPVPRCGI